MQQAIRSADEAKRYCVGRYGGDSAYLIALLLNRLRKPINAVVAQQGDVRDTLFLAHDIFRAAILEDARSLYLVQVLSKESAMEGISERMVERLTKTGDIVGIKVLGFVSTPVARRRGARAVT